MQQVSRKLRKVLTIWIQLDFPKFEVAITILAQGRHVPKEELKLGLKESEKRWQLVLSNRGFAHHQLVHHAWSAEVCDHVPAHAGGVGNACMESGRVTMPAAGTLVGRLHGRQIWGCR